MNNYVGLTDEQLISISLEILPRFYIFLNTLKEDYRIQQKEDELNDIEYMKILAKNRTYEEMENTEYRIKKDSKIIRYIQQVFSEMEKEKNGKLYVRLIIERYCEQNDVSEIAKNNYMNIKTVYRKLKDAINLYKEKVIELRSTIEE